jgi:hypothetical protein
MYVVASIHLNCNPVQMVIIIYIGFQPIFFCKDISYVSAGYESPLDNFPSSKGEVISI